MIFSHADDAFAVIISVLTVCLLYRAESKQTTKKEGEQEGSWMEQGENMQQKCLIEQK